MNRAWIPAGALAGVSVAGLIALGPLTDSLGTQVSFPGAVSLDPSTQVRTTAVPVSLDLGAVGKNTTAAAAVSQGGRETAPTTNDDSGLVGYKKTPSSHSSTVRAATVRTTHAPAVKPKKIVKRATSIGADTGPNTDQGLAGGGDSKTQSGTGALSGTPGTDAP
jgi:hypothetical protein